MNLCMYYILSNFLLLSRNCNVVVMAHLACLPQDLGGGTIMPVEGVDLPLYAMEVCLNFQY